MAIRIVCACVHVLYCCEFSVVFLQFVVTDIDCCNCYNVSNTYYRFCEHFVSCSNSWNCMMTASVVYLAEGL